MPVTLGDFTGWMEEIIPLVYQESYDNSGLQVGNPEAVIDSVLLTLDVTEEVINEAVRNKNNLIISHHPLIFTPLKRVSYKKGAERCVAEAIKNEVAVYSTHTNLDAMSWGVSRILAEKCGLSDIRVLAPLKGKLSKLVAFVPASHADKVRDAMFYAGAGHQGNYDMCSFSTPGEGTFRANKGAQPYVGMLDKMHAESEVRIEVLVPVHLVNRVVRALIKAHPYEEVAYDIIPLDNEFSYAGTGSVGSLTVPLRAEEFLSAIKKVFGTPVVRFSGDPGRMIKTVAVCGGAGAQFIGAAKRAGADAFITGDVKYHAFTEAPEDMIVADIGHFESEKYSLQLLYDLIVKKFPTFALRFSETKTNPINYF